MLRKFISYFDKAVSLNGLSSLPATLLSECRNSKIQSNQSDLSIKINAQISIEADTF